MDNLSVFNNKLAELINNSKLPLSAIALALQNSLYQIEILKLKQSQENKNIKEE